MDPKERKTYGTLDTSDVSAQGEDYSLEEILAEFGGSLEQTLLRSSEDPPDTTPAAQGASPDPDMSAAPQGAAVVSPGGIAPPTTPGESGMETPQSIPGASRDGTAQSAAPEGSETRTVPPAVPETGAASERDIPPAQAQSNAPELPPPPPPPEPEPHIPDPLDVTLPKAPRPVSLEEMVGSTVSSVMEETAATEPLLPPKRRGLFSRKSPEDTEQLSPPLEAEPASEPEPSSEPEPIGPEPDLGQQASALRAEYRRRGHLLPGAAVIALLPTALLLLEHGGVAVPGWTGEPHRQTVVLLACLVVTALLCRHVFVKAVKLLVRGRCCGELVLCLSALVSAADCLTRLSENHRPEAMPYAAVSALGLVFALWGCRRESAGMYDTFRTASLDDDPPYLVTDTPQGACKQRGSVPGFYTAATGDNGALLWQTAFLPLVLAATVVFAGLSSLGQGRGEDFLLNWSAILAAAASFSLPLGWGLAYGNLARHLQKAGSAVAGWFGAERVSRRRRMIVTDADLFPPGTVHLAGVKVFGEELPVAVSHAASMVRCAGSGLERLFDELLRTELGHYEEVTDFAFYEEGGWSGVIQGESILMGTASFMRKMDVRLPGDINLRTGLFLSVDGSLIAVFAVKYEASENVDFALRMMARSHVTPILAARDPNIVPELLRRKFHKGVKVEYPALTVRVALSEAERDRGLPRALIFREGLLPYAEAVVGSRRLCRAVRRATLISLLGSAAGALLAFYLVFLQQYALLTPLALELFSLLWTLPVLLIVDWAGRY